MNHIFMKPPHLPPKTCNIEMHNRLWSLPRLVLLTVLAIIAGIAGALSTVAWIAPSVVPDSGFFTVDREQVGEELVIDPLLERQVRQRIFNIYDTRKLVGKSFYHSGSVIFQAAILSSDGWAVAYYPEYVKNQEIGWEVVDYQGVVHGIEKTIYDPMSKMLYFKVAGEGFRIMSFDAWQDVFEGMPVWTLREGEIGETLVKDITQRDSGNSPLPIWVSRFEYTLADGLEEGDLLLNKDGELLGFVGAENSLVYGWYVSYQIASILDSYSVVYTSLPVEGYFVDKIIENDNLKSYSGFYVSYSPNRASSTTVAVGDTILAVNKKSLDSIDLARELFVSDNEVLLHILRGGDEIDVIVKKVPVK